MLLVICFFTYITESVAETMTPDPDLPEGWEFQFNAPFGQIDDITPIPDGCLLFYHPNGDVCEFSRNS